MRHVLPLVCADSLTRTTGETLIDSPGRYAVRAIFCVRRRAASGAKS